MSNWKSIAVALVLCSVIGTFIGLGIRGCQTEIYSVEKIAKIHGFEKFSFNKTPLASTIRYHAERGGEAFSGYISILLDTEGQRTYYLFMSLSGTPNKLYTQKELEAHNER